MAATGDRSRGPRAAVWHTEGSGTQGLPVIRLAGGHWPNALRWPACVKDELSWLTRIVSVGAGGAWRASKVWKVQPPGGCRIGTLGQIGLALSSAE